MRAPLFWNSPGLLSTALLPAAFLYNRLRKMRRAAPAQLPIPVICVGNLTVGGAGKTPVALYIGALLKQHNINAFFISRGYGAKLQGPLLVDPNTHSARDVGDEPLMLAGILPTVICADRVAAGNFAIAHGAKLLVMDDGFQNPSLVKTLSLLIVDGTRRFGNGRLLPAGPLREPVSEGLSRADAVIIVNPIGDDCITSTKPCFLAGTTPVDAGFVKDKRWLAFCGLAYPDKFFTTLHNLGGRVLATRAFADHHPYSAHDLASLRAHAASLGASLITTAKDIVRIPKDQRADIRVVNIALQFEQEAELQKLILATAGCA